MSVLVMVSASWIALSLFAVSLCLAAARGDQTVTVVTPASEPVPDWILTFATPVAAPARPAPVATARPAAVLKRAVMAG